MHTRRMARDVSYIIIPFGRLMATKVPAAAAAAAAPQSFYLSIYLWLVSERAATPLLIEAIGIVLFQCTKHARTTNARTRS